MRNKLKTKCKTNSRRTMDRCCIVIYLLLGAQIRRQVRRARITKWDPRSARPAARPEEKTAHTFSHFLSEAQTALATQQCTRKFLPNASFRLLRTLSSFFVFLGCVSPVNRLQFIFGSHMWRTCSGGASSNEDFFFPRTNETDGPN